MDLGVDASLYAEAHLLSSVRESDRVLERFEHGLRRLGATHLLLTGLPLPRRPVSKLIKRIVWPDRRNGGHLIDVGAGEPILSWCLAARRAVVIRRGVPEFSRLDGALDRGAVQTSELVAAAGGGDTIVVAVPIHAVTPWQGCVVIAGTEIAVSPAALAALEFYCAEALRALVATGRFDLARPGDLSERERHVLQLTSIGKTAAEIADLLAISQRTVHAHLQNASDKMNASNKTHTVTEALRYGQIRL
ncbi:MAG: helix-turn-helix domain-containing protein [Siculibacillus sp.]